MAEREKLNIYSLNVNRLGNMKKKKDVFDFLIKQSGNICLLQETHWKTKQENLIRSQWGIESVVAGNHRLLFRPLVVCLTFKTGIVKRRRPFGNFSSSLLRDIVFVNLVKQVILDLKKQYAVPVYDRKYTLDS